MSLQNNLAKITPFAIYRAGLRLLAAGKSSEERQAICGAATTRYFAKKYVPVVKNIQPQNVQRNDTDTIWQLWMPPAAGTPKIVTSCLDSVEKFRGNHNHKIITSNTELNDFIDLPGYIMDKRRNGCMTNAAFSDFVRLELLHNHGGIWMDATNFMTGEIPKIIDASDFFVFHTGTETGSPYSFIQSCFMRGNRGAFLLDAWRALAHEYWKHEHRALDYFWVHLLFRAMVIHNKTAAEFYKKMPYITQESTHRLTPRSRLLEPFDQDYWDKIAQTGFFQKLSHYGADDAPAGSYSRVIANM